MTLQTYTLYGRRKGKKLRAGKRALMENLLPELAIPGSLFPLPPEGEAPPINPLSLFPGSPQDIWLEVGFGSGEHLAAQANAHPRTGFIGCEPFLNGIAGLLSLIDAGKLENIRIWPGDARPLLDRLPDSCLGRVFALFPDPWPKKRHAGRRFIGPATLPGLARVMKPGAELRLASDDPVLQEWMEAQLAAAPDFVPAPGRLAARPPGWPPTRYGEKAVKAGRDPVYWIYRRG